MILLSLKEGRSAAQSSFTPNAIALRRDLGKVILRFPLASIYYRAKARNGYIPKNRDVSHQHYVMI